MVGAAGLFAFDVLWGPQIPTAERVTFQARGIDLAKRHAGSP
jgi:hypothetical protein